MKKNKIAFFLALKNLKSSYGLFGLVIFILAFSFINLSFFNSLNNGIEEVTNNKLINYAFADLTIVPEDGEKFITQSEDILKKVRSLDFVYGSTPRLNLMGTLFDDDNSFIPVIKGIDVDEELYVSEFHNSIARGSYLGRNSGKSIVLGDEIIGNLDGSKGTTGFETLDLDVGDQTTLSFDNGVSREYKIEGIMDTYFWIPDFYLLMSIDEMRDVYNLNEDYSSEILIKLNDGVNIDDAKVTISNLGIKGKVINSLEELSLADTILESQKVTTMLANIIGIFSTFVIIFIIIFINVSNKKKQLAILKAIGINKKIISLSYIYLALIYAFTGIIVGLIGFLLLIFYLKLNPIKLPMGFFYPSFTLFEMLTSALIIIFASILGGYFASYLTIKKNIVNVLRGVD